MGKWLDNHTNPAVKRQISPLQLISTSATPIKLISVPSNGMMYRLGEPQVFFSDRGDAGSPCRQSCGSQTQRRLAMTLINRLCIKCRGSAAPTFDAQRRKSRLCLGSGSLAILRCCCWISPRVATTWVLKPKSTRPPRTGHRGYGHPDGQDMTEMLALRHHVLVICEGRIQGELTSAQISEESNLRVATSGYSVAHESAYGS
jgi:hypothetical protein